MKSKTEKRIHLFLGILLIIVSVMLLPFSLTGFVIMNDSVKLNFLPFVSFLIAIFEIYHGVKLK
jgi:hypothetical protein